MKQNLLVDVGTQVFFLKMSSKMNSIGILQIGLKRNFDIASRNHDTLYKILHSRFNINIYDFYRTGPLEGCPFNSSGRIQLYDFFTSIEKVPDEIILKIRSDIFLTKSSMEVLCTEIDNVLNNKLDICYLGIDFKNYYDQIYYRKNAKLCTKVPDKLILARKSKLIDNWLENIHKNVSDNDSGNIAYLTIKKQNAIAYMANCQIYILKHEIIEEDNWSLYYKSMGVEGWYRKAAQAVEWVRNNKDIINKF